MTLVNIKWCLASAPHSLGKLSGVHSFLTLILGFLCVGLP